MQSACKYSHEVPERGTEPFTASQLEPAELGLPSSLDSPESHAIGERLTTAMVHLYNVHWKAELETAVELLWAICPPAPLCNAAGCLVADLEVCATQ